jgi:hypothetical protein
MMSFPDGIAAVVRLALERRDLRRLGRTDGKLVGMITTAVPASA